MGLIDWATGLTALTTIAKRLDGIEQQLTRLANAAEGLPPPAREARPAPVEPIEIHEATPNEYADAYAVEQRLRRTLGRDPDPEEILRELDGQEA